ncbi:hypothetical protein QOT17_003412 [Balamuthia mandrillaris]
MNGLGMVCQVQANHLMGSPGAQGLTKGLLANFARLAGDLEDSYHTCFTAKGFFTPFYAFQPFMDLALANNCVSLMEPVWKTILPSDSFGSTLHLLLKYFWKAMFVNKNNFFRDMPLHMANLLVSDLNEDFLLHCLRRNQRYWLQQQRQLRNEEEQQRGHVASGVAICAGTAALSCLVQMPLETLIQRMRMHPELYSHVEVEATVNVDNDNSTLEEVCGGAWWTVQRILEEEGGWGFYKGLAIRFLAQFLYNIVTFYSEKENNHTVVHFQ